MRQRILRSPPSLRCTSLVAAIHLIAATAFLHLPFLSLIGFFGLFALVVSFALHFVRRRTLVFVLDDEGRFARLDAGEELEARLEASTTDFGFVVWLVWSEPPSRRLRGRMLLRADYPEEEWRALSIWLRHRAPAARNVSGGV